MTMYRNRRASPPTIVIRPARRSLHRASLSLLALVVLSAGGCGDRVPATEPTESCTGRAEPLGSDAVVRAFRKQGFSARTSTTSRDCGGFDVADGDEAPGFAVSNTDAAGRAPGSEGTLYCLLRQGPIWGPTLELDADAKPSSPIFTGKKAEASLANLECTLYPDEANAA